jgi:hypothetical protein
MALFKELGAGRWEILRRLNAMQDAVGDGPETPLGVDVLGWVECLGLNVSSILLVEVEGLFIPFIPR